jgi:hypothetical protein
MLQGAVQISLPGLPQLALLPGGIFGDPWTWRTCARTGSLDVMCHGCRHEVLLNVRLLVREFGPRMVCTKMRDGRRRRPAELVRAAAMMRRGAVGGRCAAAAVPRFRPKESIRWRAVWCECGYEFRVRIRHRLGCRVGPWLDPSVVSGLDSVR